MDSDTDRIVARLNLEEIINNYNTKNQLIVGKIITLYDIKQTYEELFLTLKLCTYIKLNCLK